MKYQAAMIFQKIKFTIINSVNSFLISGRRFAEQEMYVMIIKLLQKFELEWHHEPMSQEYRMLLVPDKPAQFTFKDRHS